MHIFCLALLAAWVLPLHLPPWVSWHKEVLVLFALNFWLVAVFVRRMASGGWRCTISLPSSISCPVALIGVAVVQYASGLLVFGGDAIVLVLYFFYSAAALSLGFRRAQQEEVVKTIAITFLVGGVLSVGIALAQAFTVWSDSPFVASLHSLRRPGANLAQANHLATLLVFSWASLVFLHLNNVVGRLTLVIATGWLVLGVAVTESRTGLVSLCLLMGWCFIYRNSICSKLSMAAIAAGAMFYLACLIYWPAFLQCYWMDAMAGGSASINLTAGTRIVVWPQLWEAVMLRPWLGWGLLGVASAHNSVLHNYSQADAFSYAHSIALDGLIGVGIPLALLAFSALIFWIKKRIRALHDPVTWYCFAVALPLGVHSMLEYPFAYSFLLFPVVLLVGVIESRSPNAARFNLPMWMGATLVVCATTLGLLVTREYLLIEEDFRVARFEALRIGQTDPEYQRPKIHLLTQLGAMLQATRIVPGVSMSPDEIEILRLATMRFPWTAIQNKWQS